MVVCEDTEHGGGIALVVPTAQYGISSCIISSPPEKGPGMMRNASLKNNQFFKPQSVSPNLSLCLPTSVCVLTDRNEYKA